MSDIITIDCHYERPEIAASYLIKGRSKAAFIENNTSRALPHLLDGLRQNGFSPDQVEFAIITHVHLDHAGGSSALMEACPNAVLLAHPRAAKHIIDPSRLISSSKIVYGESKFHELYGEIRGVDPARVRIPSDGETIRVADRDMTFIYTRGHANHHFCIYDQTDSCIFTGDTFGLAYPALQKHGLFIYPSTTPTDFDPAEARLSIQKILDTGARRAYLTHFGPVEDIQAAAQQLREGLDFYENLLDSAKSRGGEMQDLEKFCEDEVRAYIRKKMDAGGGSFDSSSLEIMELDIGINAQGIAFKAMR